MKSYKKILFSVGCATLAGLLITGCQKLDRPALGEIIPDPPPPPVQVLGAQTLLHFDGNTRDTGSLKLPTTAGSVAFVEGVSGQAAQIGTGGWIKSTAIPNELKNPGSISVAFWMKAPTGPIAGGAQGLFALSKSDAFWGNFEIFLENYSDAADANAAFLKMHLFNANIAGGGEQWIQDDAVKIKNVLGKWTHIAITYDAATSKFIVYKDGAVASERILAGGAYGPLKFDNLTGMTVGTFAFQVTPTLASHGAETWAKSFNGALDYFRIYTKALSAAEVANLHTNKL
jgi:hypothetical protein